MFVLVVLLDGLEHVVSLQFARDSEQIKLEYVWDVVLVTLQILALVLMDISETIVNSLVALEN